MDPVFWARACPLLKCYRRPLQPRRRSALADELLE